MNINHPAGDPGGDHEERTDKMNRIETLLKRIEAATGESYEVMKFGRGDWSLYRCVNDDCLEFIVNTLGAAPMIEVLEAMLAAADNR